jgi:pimeloyl-ACP methyl ester carboxylesterase
MRTLGYHRFAAQGGDIGAGVSTVLGLHHADHIIGIHLNFIPGSYRPYLETGTTLTRAEQKFIADGGRWCDENGDYAHLLT